MPKTSKRSKRTKQTKKTSLWSRLNKNNFNRNNITKLTFVLLFTIVGAWALYSANAEPTSFYVMPEHDAYVLDSSPNQNYNSTKYLRTNNKNGECTSNKCNSSQTAQTFLKFTVTNIPAKATVDQVTLEMYVNDDGPDGGTLYKTDNNWSESTVTWNNRPTTASQGITSVSNIKNNQWVKFDIPVDELPTNGTYSFALLSNNRDMVGYQSRENVQPPKLTISYKDTSITSKAPPDDDTEASICPDIASGECRPFSSSSPWNTPIPSNASIHPMSTTYINAIADNNLPLTSDIDQYTIPMYLYDSETPRSPVKIQNYFSSYDNGDDSRVGYGYAPTIQDVPIPPLAVAGAGSDGQITFWDPVEGVEYGFWQFKKNSDGTYSATSGWRYHTTEDYTGTFADGKAGRGAGTTYSAGLVRKWEIDQGKIDHALAFAYKYPAKEHVYPASKSDGLGTTGIDAPEGSRLQLNPNLTDEDFDRMGLSPMAKTIAKALQEYGMYIIDNSGSSKLYVEDRRTANWPSDVNRDLLSNIPWSEFRVVQ